MSIISRMNEKKQFANENKWFQKEFHAAECLLKTKKRHDGSSLIGLK